MSAGALIQPQTVPDSAVHCLQLCGGPAAAPPTPHVFCSPDHCSKPSIIHCHKIEVADKSAATASHRQCSKEGMSTELAVPAAGAHMEATLLLPAPPICLPMCSTVQLACCVWATPAADRLQVCLTAAPTATWRLATCRICTQFMVAANHATRLRGPPVQVPALADITVRLDPNLPAAHGTCAAACIWPVSSAAAGAVSQQATIPNRQPQRRSQQQQQHCSTSPAPFHARLRPAAEVQLLEGTFICQ